MIVASDGSGDYLSLGEALKDLEKKSEKNGRVVIHLKKECTGRNCT